MSSAGGGVASGAGASELCLDGARSELARGGVEGLLPSRWPKEEARRMTVVTRLRKLRLPAWGLAEMGASLGGLVAGLAIADARIINKVVECERKSAEKLRRRGWV